MIHQNGSEKSCHMSTKNHRSKSKDLVYKFSVLTLSDTRTEETDTSGLYISETLSALGHERVHYEIIPDELDQISDRVKLFASESDLLITTGGTGISNRDSTIDVVTKILETELPGFGEIFRVLSYEEVGPAAILSRATCGVHNNCLIFCLPGSRNAVGLGMDKIIAPEINHLLWELLVK